MRVELRNIRKANVSVYADGVPVDAQVKTDGYVIVTLPSIQRGVTYVIEAEIISNEKAERKRFFDVLTRVEISHAEKDAILHQCRVGKDAVIEQIMKSKTLTENEKLYLTEIL